MAKKEPSLKEKLEKETEKLNDLKLELSEHQKKVSVQQKVVDGLILKLPKKSENESRREYLKARQRALDEEIQQRKRLADAQAAGILAAQANTVADDSSKSGNKPKTEKES